MRQYPVTTKAICFVKPLSKSLFSDLVSHFILLTVTMSLCLALVNFVIVDRPGQVNCQNRNLDYDVLLDGSDKLESRSFPLENPVTSLVLFFFYALHETTTDHETSSLTN